jgi:quinohemoprotein ethanol dehydrogenase
MILADLTIDGAPRKVILHAPKQRFFFVIDRTNGKFISAKNFVDVNWATGYDAAGRPIEVAARSPDKPFDSIPGPYGAHNWHPMSFNPSTGLVYLPAQNIGQPDRPEELEAHANQPGEFMGSLGWNVGYALNATPPKPRCSGD